MKIIKDMKQIFITTLFTLLPMLMLGQTDVDTRIAVNDPFFIPLFISTFLCFIPFTTSNILFQKFGSYKIISYLCHQSRKDLLGRRRVVLPNLRYENLKIFLARLIKRRRQNSFHVYCLGLCSIFFNQVFLGPSYRN